MGFREQWGQLDTGVKILVGLGVGLALLVIAIPVLIVLSAVVASFDLGLGDAESAAPEEPQVSMRFDYDADTEAMDWAATETRPDATFVVFSDAAEWFPIRSDRTILVSPWGAEWRGPDTYGAHLTAFVNGSECANRSCAEAAMARVDADPDYVYVPKGEYTVRGDYQYANGTLGASFAESPRYERAFENEGVVVFRRETA